jgi:hypothetical protein
VSSFAAFHHLLPSKFIAMAAKGEAVQGGRSAAPMRRGVAISERAHAGQSDAIHSPDEWASSVVKDSEA